eukprot:8197110-Alexandrium_andersonii.AAC.1
MARGRSLRAGMIGKAVATTLIAQCGLACCVVYMVGMLCGYVVWRAMAKTSAVLTIAYVAVCIAGPFSLNE